MKNESKIIIFPNVDLDHNFDLTKKVSEFLCAKGKTTVVCPLIYEDMPYDVSTLELDSSDLENELPSAEMIITIGGDGTVLRAARLAAEMNVPILGINAGGKGFMAELELDDIALLNMITDNLYRTESRMMLNAVIVRDGETLYQNFALNDVVIKGDNKVIDLALYGDNQQIMRFSGDGVVIATPTGSTAYSMAAGGPIVEPSAQNIIVTPICAHVLVTKSIVLASDRRVTAKIEHKKHNPAYVSIDGGKHLDILDGDVINISKSELSTRFVRIKERSFYQKVNEKL